MHSSHYGRSLGSASEEKYVRLSQRHRPARSPVWMPDTEASRYPKPITWPQMLWLDGQSHAPSAEGWLKPPAIEESCAVLAHVYVLCCLFGLPKCSICSLISAHRLALCTVVSARLSISNAGPKKQTQLSLKLQLRYRCLNSRCGILLQGVHAAEDHGCSS